MTVGDHGGEGISCLAAKLNPPLKPGKSVDLQSVATFTQMQKPFPASIFQNEPQRVLYQDTVHLLLPYKVLTQKTKVTFDSALPLQFQSRTPNDCKQNFLPTLAAS